MEKKKIIVLGGGGHAKVVAGTLLRLPEYEVIGFLDDAVERASLLETRKLGKMFPVPQNLETTLLALGIGHVGKTAFRNKLIKEYEEAGYTFETVVAPSAIINHGVTLGKGVFISDMVTLHPEVIIDDYAIISNSTCINHECRIGRNTHICPGVMISGNVVIGSDSLLGTGSSAIHGITIGNECIISAGHTVIKNLKDKEHVSLFKFKQ